MLNFRSLWTMAAFLALQACAMETAVEEYNKARKGQSSVEKCSANRTLLLIGHTVTNRPAEKLVRAFVESNAYNRILLVDRLAQEKAAQDEPVALAKAIQSTSTKMMGPFFSDESERKKSRQVLTWLGQNMFFESVVKEYEYHFGYIFQQKNREIPDKDKVKMSVERSSVEASGDAFRQIVKDAEALNIKVDFLQTDSPTEEAILAKFNATQANSSPLASCDAVVVAPDRSWIGK